MARHDFLIDVAINARAPDLRCLRGRAEQAHAAVCEFVSGAMLHELDGQVDAAVTTAAGYPLDLTFYQAIKGITAAAQIVKPGGRILLIAACQEGVGGQHFWTMLRSGMQDAEFLRHIEGAPVSVDQWQLEKLALVTTRQRLLYFVPGLPPEYHADLWGTAYETLDGALQKLFAGLPAKAKVAVIPEGPYVLAKAKVPELAAV